MTEETWKVALIGFQPGVFREEAATALLEMTSGVTDPLSARRLLKKLPASVQVYRSRLEEFKTIFKTKESFHFCRVWDAACSEREIWVTVPYPDEDTAPFFDFAFDLVRFEVFASMLWGSSLRLANGVMIHFGVKP